MRPPGASHHATPAPPSAAPPLDVNVTPAPYGALVAITGELDLATVPRVSEALAAEPVAGARAVVVDLAGVTFMDSTGLAALLDFERELAARGGRLVLACPEGPARLLLDVTGVAGQLALHPTREAAEAAAPRRDDCYGFVRLGCGPSGRRGSGCRTRRRLPSCGSTMPSLFSWPKDCDWPPGPFGGAVQRRARVVVEPGTATRLALVLVLLLPLPVTSPASARPAQGLRSPLARKGRAPSSIGTSCPPRSPAPPYPLTYRP